MALGLFSKAKILIQAGSHALLDKIIDANSIPAHEQIIRELEAAMQQESTATIKADVEVNSLGTKITAIQSQIDDFNAAIEVNLNDGDPSNDHEAEIMMTHIMELESERDEIAASQTAAKENHKLLSDTLAKLKQRHTQMMKELRALRTATAQASADEQALKAVRKANDLATGVDSMHLGGALEKAKQASQVARAELREAVGSVQDTPEALLQKSKAASRIAEMRAKLNK